MELNEHTHVLIVGLGLIGGSYARALTRRGYRVSAITKEPDDIAYALREGIIAEGAATPDPRLIGAADLIVLALYPHLIPEWIRDNAAHIRPGTLLVDTAGIKTELVGAVHRVLPAGAVFVGTHPMAGREVGGVRNSDDAIFRGANYIVVPTPDSTPEGCALAAELGRVLGFSRISELTPERHDEMVGFLSQLTHCIAISLMTCNRETRMEEYTGDSFRDLTRIARINEELWSELFLSNRDALLRQFDAFETEMRTLRDLLARGDRAGLKDLMRLSTARRALFDKTEK